MLIYFIGFMGSGKSTLAALAAQHWNESLHDTDQLMASRGIDVSHQLRRNPVKFRLGEAQLTAQLIQLNSGVIALGGGAIENEGTRAILKGKPVLFLDPGVDICWQRVQSHSQHRPLATDYASFVSLYLKRLPLYLDICRWHLTDNLPPEVLLQKLESLKLDNTPTE